MNMQEWKQIKKSIQNIFKTYKSSKVKLDEWNDEFEINIRLSKEELKKEIKND